MEQLFNGFTLEIPPDAFPLSTDSMALAGFVRLPKNARVLDLGSGCATLGLLLCARYDNCAVTGIELTQSAHLAALRNIARNALDARLVSICADLNTIPERIQPGSFHCCVSNPPYFTAGPASTSVPLARREDQCTMDDLFRAAAWALRFGGDFFLVHRPERLGQLFGCAVQAGLEPKQLCLLRHRSDGPVSLVLVQCRKGAKPGLIWQEESLMDASGHPTDYYKRIYHLQEDPI